MENTVFTSFTQGEFKALLTESIKEVLKEVLPQMDSAPDVLTINEAAKLLRYKITTLYEKTSKRIIPHFKKGNKLYFNKTDLLNWVSLGKRKTQVEIEGEASTYTLTNKK